MSGEDKVVHGIESFMNVIVDVIQKLVAIVEMENKMLVSEDQAPLIIQNSAFQRSKQEVYDKFEALSRIINAIITKDKPSMDKAILIHTIMQVQKVLEVVSLNQILMQRYLMRQTKLITAVMASIEKSSTPKMEKL